MSTEANKEMFRRLIDEAFNAGDVGVVDDLVTLDFVEHEQVEPGAGSGREAAKGMMEGMCAAFPDMQETVDSVIAEGDTVAARTTWCGTHLGEFMGVPATGKPVEFEAIVAGVTYKGAT